jgi:hypothetical protein
MTSRWVILKATYYRFDIESPPKNRLVVLLDGQNWSK